MLRVLTLISILLCSFETGLGKPSSSGSGSRSTYSSKSSKSSKSSSGSSSKSSSKSGYSSKTSPSSSSKSNYSSKSSGQSSSGHSSKTSPKPSGKSSYSSSKTSQDSDSSTKTFQNPGSKTAHPDSSWDPSGTKAAQREESRKLWEAEQDRQTKAKRDQVNRDRQVGLKKEQARKEQTRNYQNTWSPEKQQSRSVRERDFYRDVSPPLSVPRYHDGYSSLFWTWMLLQSMDRRAEWAYHHRYTMDPSRYEELLSSNEELRAKVGKLEADKVARDPNYKPPGMQDPDLMYKTEHLQEIEAESQHITLEDVFYGAAWVLVFGGVAAALYGVWYGVFRFKF